MDIYSELQHNYEVEIEVDLDEHLPIFHYPGANRVGKDGKIVKILPKEGNPWFGVFESGEHSTVGIDALAYTPDPEKVCVVNNGSGYFVSSHDPNQWTLIRAFPIKQLLILKEENLILFVDYTSITAYNSTGLRWVSDRISMDGLSVEEVKGNKIYGKYRDLRSECESTFVLDLGTGKS
jgi:hypothetical protein